MIQSNVHSLPQHFTSFLTKGRGQFEGSPAFSEQMVHVIGEAAELKVGRLVMQRLLERGKPVAVQEGVHESLTGGNEMNPENGVISLNFTAKYYYVSRNEKGERELFEIPPVSQLIHELIHMSHHLSDAEAFKRRVMQESSIKNMHSQEEEFTITGQVIGTDESDPCNEHALHDELKLPLRLDHVGYSKLEGVEGLRELILGNVIFNLREKLSTEEGVEEFAAAKEELMALALKQMRDHPDGLAVVELLIEKGFTSNTALDTVAEMICKHRNPDLQKRLIILFLQLKERGCQLRYNLFLLVEMIEQSSNLWEKILWSKMIEPWVVQRLNQFAGQLEEEFLYYMELLFRNRYDPIWLQLFEMSTDLADVKNQCQSELAWIHQNCHSKTTEALRGRLPEEPVRRIAALDELLHAVFYIAVAAKSFFKAVPAEADQKFAKQRKLFESILQHHDSRDYVKSAWLNQRLVTLSALKVNYL